MIDGQFPSYERIIPRGNHNIAAVPRAAFTAAIRRVGLVAAENKATTFTLKSNQIELTAVSAEVGDAVEQCVAFYTGPELKISANWSYVLDFLEASSGDLITIAVKDDATPFLFGDGPDFINVVMGMRL
jgi:DNA polymerase-3 subunit beta